MTVNNCIIRCACILLTAAMTAQGAEIEPLQPGGVARAEDLNAIHAALNADGTANAAAIDVLRTDLETIELTPGPQGAAGPQGQQGPPGPQGTGVSGAGVLESGQLELMLDDGSSILTVQSIIGPPGDVDLMDSLCPAGGSVQGFEGGVPICSTDPNRCEDNLVARGAAEQCDFSGQSFTDLDLRWTRIDGANFSNALIGSSLDPIAGAEAVPPARGADIAVPVEFTAYHTARRTIGKFASGDRVNFSGATLTDVLFIEVNLIGADFRGANIVSSGIEIDGVIVGRSGLIESTLRQGNFSNVMADGVDLLRCSCLVVDFTGAVLTNANLFEGNFAVSSFKGANLSSARASQANFSQTSFDNTSVLDGTTFSGSELTVAKFDGASAIGASFTSIRADATDFTGTDLTDARFSHARGVSTVFADATLIRAGFFGAEFRSASFAGADMRDASLVSGDFRFSNFTGADLTGANLFQANLTGANLTNAIFGNTTCPSGVNSDSNGGSCSGQL